MVSVVFDSNVIAEIDEASSSFIPGDFHTFCSAVDKRPSDAQFGVKIWAFSWDGGARGLMIIRLLNMFLKGDDIYLVGGLNLSEKY